MKLPTEAAPQTTVAARVAGEDICTGDFVAVLSEIAELPSYLWCGSADMLPVDELVRIRYVPHEARRPFKVFAVCLPFVYVKPPRDNLLCFDTRKQQLVRLDSANAKVVWKQLKKKKN
jgi:hypothetical protein